MIFAAETIESKIPSVSKQWHVHHDPKGDALYLQEKYSSTKEHISSRRGGGSTLPRLFLDPEELDHGIHVPIFAQMPIILPHAPVDLDAG